MIGVGKLLTVGATPVTEYSVIASPSFLQAKNPNGGTTSTPSCSASVSGGVGPFEYLWSVDNPKISISNKNSSNVFFSASAVNGEIEGVATVKVTDTGNANQETTDSVSVLLIFGNL